MIAVLPMATHGEVLASVVLLGVATGCGACLGSGVVSNLCAQSPVILPAAPCRMMPALPFPFTVHLANKY